jgi:pentatricopeptide repeat protein
MFESSRKVIPLRFFFNALKNGHRRTLVAVIIRQLSTARARLPVECRQQWTRYNWAVLSETKHLVMPFSTSTSHGPQQLQLAAQSGHGEQAEAILQQILEEAAAAATTRTKNGSSHPESMQDQRSAISLALHAWENSKSTLAASRAHSLLDRMITMSLLSKDADATSRGFPYPSPQDFNTVLRCWSKPLSVTLTGQAATQTEQLLEAMAQVGGEWQPSIESYTAYLSVLANVGEAEQAQKVLDDLFENYISCLSSPKITTTESTKMSTTSSSSSSITTVTTSVVRPTLEACHIVLAAWCKIGTHSATEQAERFLEQMQRHCESGVLSDGPNRTSYNLVLDGWSNHATRSSSSSSSKSSSNGAELHRAATRAQALFDTMKEAGVPPNSSTYNSVISVLARAGLAEEAEWALTQLTLHYSSQFDADLKPSIAPFQNVLLAWSKSGHSQAAQRAGSFLKHMAELHDAQLLDTKPNVYSYNIVLHCWAVSNPADGGGGGTDEARKQAVELLEEMQDQEVIPDTTSINCLLDVFANSGKADEAEALLWQFYQKHLEDPRNNPQPNIISFTTVLKAWSRSASPEAGDKIMSLFTQLQELSDDSGWDHCQPDLVTYVTVMIFWANSRLKGAASRAEAILRSMQESKLNAASGDSRLPPDTVCWNTVINAYAKEGNAEKCEALFTEMWEGYQKGEHGAKPNMLTFTAILSSWAKCRTNPKAPLRAEEVLQSMYDFYQSGVLNVKPNVISYTIVLDCLANVQRTWAAERAESILRYMIESGDELDIRPNIVSYNSVIKAWSGTQDAKAVTRVTALLAELMEIAEIDPAMRPRVQTFGSVLKTVAASHLPGRAQRAKAVVSMMQKYNVTPDDYCTQQLSKCQQDHGDVRRHRVQN